MADLNTAFTITPNSENFKFAKFQYLNRCKITPTLIQRKQYPVYCYDIKDGMYSPSCNLTKSKRS